MLVKNLADALNRIAPLEFAEEWDRVGLLVGRLDAPLSGPVVLTIDLTGRVLAEAVDHRAAAVVAYHPPIWEPLRRVTDATPGERVVLRALEERIAIYSPHTALDAAPGGLNDWLCEGLSAGAPGKIAGDCRALTPHPSQPATQQLKIVTFVPAQDADRLRSALATAGAGIIGNYQLCSFATPGFGTFFGNEQSSPRVGEPQRLERVEELRLEMVCSRGALALAVETLRRFHPYEEPAIDVYPLEPQPQRSAGAGRRLVLDAPVTVGALAERLKGFLAVPSVQVALCGNDQPITHVGVCAGAGSGMLSLAIADGCQVYVTGELKHHEILGALRAGVSVLLAGHTNTERGYLPRLAERLSAELPGVRTILSREDRDPLRTI